jgi:ABC-type uncharacterized transport system involved in gliding motility auxiliary subunit
MKKLSFRMAFGLVVLLLLAIALFVNGLLSNLHRGRLDLTEDNLYTLSPAAEDILAKLQVPVQVKFYITRSDKMPTELKTLERDVTDKLRDYAAASRGRLEYTVHDPTDDEQLQELLQGKGVRPFQVQSVERDEIGLKLIYSAITVAYKDKTEEVLPQILPQSLATLEYELVSRIFRMTQDKEPVVALFAPKPRLDPQMLSMYMQMGMQPPEMPDTWQPVVETLQGEHFDVRRIDLTPESPIPAETDVLLVLGPDMLNARQSWEIGNALSSGVNTLMAVQKTEYSYNPGPRGGFSITARQKRTGLEELLNNYGIAVSADQLFDAENEVLSIPRTQNLMGMRVQTAEPVRAPMQIAVRGDQFNREIDITNRIETLFYLWGTDIMTDPARMAGLNMGSRVLFTASERSWRKPFSAEPLTMADIDTRNRDFMPKLPLACIFEGQFPAPAGEKPAWPSAPPAEGEAPTAPPMSPDAFTGGSPRPAKLILAGCGKLFEDPFIGAGQNALFLLNSVDALAIGGELIGIRSKMITERSLRSADAGEKLVFRIFTVVLVPVLLAFYGVLRMIMRRKESAMYQDNLSLGRR